MKKICIYISLSFLILYGCDLSDHVKDCGNDYIFMFEGGGLNKIGKELRRNSNSISYDLVIPQGVVDYSYDDQYILAVQVSDSIFTNSIQEDNYLRDTSNHQYWIIESDKDIVHGPLSKNRFQNLRIKLGVPLDLKAGEGELELLREW